MLKENAIPAEIPPDQHERYRRVQRATDLIAETIEVNAIELSDGLNAMASIIVALFDNNETEFKRFHKELKTVYDKQCEYSQI